MVLYTWGSLVGEGICGVVGLCVTWAQLLGDLLISNKL